MDPQSSQNEAFSGPAGRCEPPLRLGYVALHTPDLAAAKAFYQDKVHLDVRYEDEDSVYLSGSGDHHWLVLQQSGSDSPPLARLAYEVASRTALTAARERLESAGVNVSTAQDRGIVEAIDFYDPDGLPLRLFVGMEYDAAPKRQRWVNHGELLHVGLSVENAARSADFYKDLLGFQLSDWVGRTGAFLRAANRFHHSLVLLERGSPKLDHICFHMESFDDLMRARALLLEDSATIKADLIRHAPSNSVGMYLHAQPKDVTVELCVWHDKIEDGWQARTLTSSPWAYNQWTPPNGNDEW